MHGGGRVGRAAGLVGGAAAAGRGGALRPRDLRRRAAGVRAARVLRAHRRQRARRAHLPPHIPRHDHAQPDLVDRRGHCAGERFLLSVRCETPV